MSFEEGTEAVAAELAGVSKRFGDTEAVRELDLHVPKGRILGLIGHNAAGKTTVMKMLLGILTPTTGRVRLLGREPRGAEGAQTRRRVGYLPENVAFYDQLTGAEVLGFFADLKGVGRRRCREVLAGVGLERAGDRKVRTYSKGMRQRLGLAQALLGEPDMLLLDEPTVGLDPQATEEFYARLEELRSRGATIILSSHILAEIEERADTLAILGHGRLLAEGNLRALRQRAGLRIRIRVRGRDLGGLRDTLNALENVGAEGDGDGLRVTCGEAQKLTVLERVTATETVSDVEVAPPSLADIYSHFGLAGEGAG
ncbi:ABC transporter ATP-binding protein [Thiohalorhabdus sp. Cl-TMA]|uniref:ATP-binding cassette domain-containing protein n=1 Tax=Thiohalorhabdus methylotrophus TaxID=3242694 RepID=A0ABV4TRZ4_9GAMM